MGLFAAAVAPPTWPAWAAAGQFIAANAARMLVTAGVIGAGAVAANQVQQARDLARARDEAGTTTLTCANCRDNPCRHLAAGVPGSPYRGGAHGALGGPVGDQIESHHTPAKAASYLHENVGPAIQMDEADHRRTASHGRMPGHAAYIAQQRSAVAGGRFLAATQMDVANIRQLFGNKYDGAIAQMEAYTLCLKQNGLIR